MGDLIELTTWPKRQVVVYKITSSGFWFDVRGSGSATIALSITKGKCKNFDYLIGIDTNTTWIGVVHETKETERVNIPGLLNVEKFNRFWLTWDSGSMKLGLNGSKEAILHCRCKTKSTNLQFVGFHGTGVLHWRFELPPIRQLVPEKPMTKLVSGGEPRWVQAGDQLPEGAVIGGYEGETLYIIRALYRQSLTPGKFIPSQGIGYISWGGWTSPTNEFEILCGFDCIWVPTDEDKIPKGAIVGGYVQPNQEPLYIGRYWHNGHLIPGKVHASYKKCFVAYDEQELGNSHYEILISPTINSNPKR